MLTEHNLEITTIKTKENEEKLKELQGESDKLKTLFDQKQHSKARRANTSTTVETVSSTSSSTRYRRRQETQHVLEYIHGGNRGAVYGAWDFLSARATKEDMDAFLSMHKRGKYLQGLLGQAIKDYNFSHDALKQAVALKYQNFLSRRKYNLLCKTQSSAFDADGEVWVPRNMKCLGIDLRVPFTRVTDEKVEKFIKSLDIGHVNQIPNVPGVTRTMTGLVFMIIDLHQRLPHLSKKIVWFNENTNHYIFQFSDDGAPETNDLSMSIGSVTLWNLEERSRSREFQYLLHCVSLGEKHKVLELLWQQHTEEMLLLESSIFTLNGKECTLEFQPGADMSWQSWAANEVNQAATHPSPYASVQKGNIATMGATIGFGDADLWQAYTSSVRSHHLKSVREYLASLPSGLTKNTLHNKKLEFMAANGIRQLGEPRIGIFADRLRPDPLHCEINAWQHVLDLVYLEAVQRGKFDEFLELISAPVKNSTQTEDIICDNKVDQTANEGAAVVPEDVSDNAETTQRANERYSMSLKSISELPVTKSSSVMGCGLQYLSSKIKEHYSDESKRFNKLPVRLIGDQAITLSRYIYRVIDGLQSEEESQAQKIRRLAISKIAEYLRNAGGLFNKIHTNSSEIDQLADNCRLYFNLFALFFPKQCQCYGMDSGLCNTISCPEIV